MDYNSILLATDLSPIAEGVARKAEQIASRCNAKLNVIHVIEYSPMAYGGEFSIPVDVNLMQAIQQQAREAMEKLTEHMNLNGGELFIKEGAVKADVINIAKEQNTDLIVVGSHSHHGIEHLLGSHANAILHAAQCDVLSIRV